MNALWAATHVPTAALILMEVTCAAVLEASTELDRVTASQAQASRASSPTVTTKTVCPQRPAMSVRLTVEERVDGTDATLMKMPSIRSLW